MLLRRQLSRPMEHLAQSSGRHCEGCQRLKRMRTAVLNSAPQARLVFRAAVSINRPLLTAWPHPLGRYYDPECLGANPIMKRRIHNTDFAVRGHVDSWGPGLHPYLVRLERV